MKIFNSQQIKEWDNFTIKTLGISENDLVQRAATAALTWLQPQLNNYSNIYIFCGRGNNGADGLALGNLLLRLGYPVSTYRINGNYSESNAFFAQSISEKNILHTIETSGDFPPIPAQTLVIDALLGIGIKGDLQELYSQLILHLNDSKQTIISLDIASGLPAEEYTEVTAITATHTLTFEQYKLAHFRAAYQPYNGQVHLLKIGLAEAFVKHTDAQYQLINTSVVQQIIKPRGTFAHKGDFGHAGILAGSYGMMGAAVLSAQGCLSAGVGKLTNIVPKIGYEIMQISVPESMCMVSGEEYLQQAGDLSNFTAVGIGPGIGSGSNIVNILQEVFMKKLPTIVDADALNVMAAYPNLFQMLTEDAILTPHPGEFKRMFGEGDLFSIALDKAQQHYVYIVLKGKYTLIATPAGKGYFIPTGNSGMAKGGMGDVLTGIITGLRAQGYSSEESCILGCYLHGLAGDLAALGLSTSSMQARDVVKFMSEAWQLIQQPNADEKA